MRSSGNLSSSLVVIKEQASEKIGESFFDSNKDILPQKKQVSFQEEEPSSNRAFKNELK